MIISPINRNFATNYYSEALASGFITRSMQQIGNLPEIEPVRAIAGAEKQDFDKNDIDYKRITEYERKLFGEQKISGQSESDEYTVITAIPNENDKTNRFNNIGEKTDENTSTVGKTSDSIDNKRNETESNEKTDDPTLPRKPNGEPLSDAEQNLVKELKVIDQQVKAHEQAHLSAAGGLATSGSDFHFYTRTRWQSICYWWRS